MDAATSFFDKALESIPLNPEKILRFRLPKRFQARASQLVRKNSSGQITDEETVELQRFLVLEATVRALKAKALLAIGKK